MFGWFRKNKSKNGNGYSGSEIKGDSPKSLADGLVRTRSSFTEKIEALFLGRKKIDEDLLEELEEILITADLGVSTAQELLDLARGAAAR